jgi:hypothetical protein
MDQLEAMMKDLVAKLRKEYFESVLLLQLWQPFMPHNGT